MSDTALRRPGGRTARVRDAVLAAAVAELVERGGSAVSLDAIASRAGVSKGTVYRRWGGRDGVVLAAVEWYGVGQADVPDTGSLDEDLRRWARSIAGMLADPSSRALVLAVFSGDPTATRPLRRRFWQSRLELVRPLVERAVARAELPADVDVEEVVRQLGAPLYYRAVVLLEPVTAADADRAAAATAAAARAGALRRRPPADPPAEASRSLRGAADQE
jgi:AcrR family transcriptional regulator